MPDVIFTVFLNKDDDDDDLEYFYSLPPPPDGMLAHCRVTTVHVPALNSPAHIYTPVWRETL